MKLSTRRAPSAARLAALIAAGLALGATQQAMAGGTAAGSTIDNQATLSFSVGGVSQTAVPSNTASFVVDNKVNLLVTETGSTYTQVAPGASAQVTTFQVFNTGNKVQDYALTTANLASGTTINLDGGAVETDNFNGNGCSVFVESGATAGYQAGQDTATYIDELAVDQNKTAYVVCAIPVGQANDSYAIVSLTAEALAGGVAGTQGATLTNAATDTAGEDVVFADGQGTDDAATPDAKYSARDAYHVASAILSVSKAVALVCDPINGTSNPKNIPGAIVKWTVTVSNAATAGSAATLAQVTDTLDTNTTFDGNLVTGAGGAAGCVSGAPGVPESATGSGFKLDVTGDTRPGTYPKFLTTAANGDGGTQAGGLVTIDYSLAMPAEGTYSAGELRPGESAVVTFNVTIN